jgi:hypothetical protein
LPGKTFENTKFKIRRKKMSGIKDVFSNVKFKKEGGPITIEVTSGFSSLGSFILAYSEIGKTDYHEFGKEPKCINDKQADMFLIPIDLKEISKYVVFIIGKYSPAPGRTQIKVNYEFVQDGELLEIKPKNGNVIEENTTNGVLRFTHYFGFKPEEE